MKLITYSLDIKFHDFFNRTDATKNIKFDSAFSKFVRLYSKNSNSIRLLFYGAGQCARFAMDYLKKYDEIYILQVVDRNAKHTYELTADIEVFHPDNIKPLESFDVVFIATSPSHYSEICDTLSNLKSSKKNIPVVTLFKNCEKNFYIKEITHNRETINYLPNIILATIPKSGSLWLSGMLREFVEKPFDYHYEINRETEPHGQQLERFSAPFITWNHYSVTDVESYLSNSRYKFIFLYRDLRDQVISWSMYYKYFYRYREQNDSIHRFLAQFTDEKTLSLFITGYEGSYLGKPIKIIPITRNAEIACNWISYSSTNKNIFITCYEDLINEPQVTLESLFSFLKLPASSEKILQVIENYQFRRMSGGRRQGKENKTSHYRKGIIGDWKNYFTSHHKRLFKNAIGDFLISTGYEENNDW